MLKFIKLHTSIIYILFFLIVFSGLLFGFWLNSQIITTETAKVVRVVDGDTIYAQTNTGEIKVRLLGIDTPESVHPNDQLNTQAGQYASDYLKQILLPGQTIYLENDPNQDNIDKYGRVLRYVWTEPPSQNLDNMINIHLIKTGYAKVNFFGHDVAKYYIQFLSAQQEYENSKIKEN